jgi:hypothetical protein
MFVSALPGGLWWTILVVWATPYALRGSAKHGLDDPARSIHDR